MPPLGVSANADGTDNVLRQLIHEQSKRPDRSAQLCARALADANEPGCIACSHAVAWLKFKKRARSPGIKNAFDFKPIDAESGSAGSGRLSVRCLLYVRFAHEACSPQEKLSCRLARLMPRVGSRRAGWGV